jgi:alkylation response protein AidB-like acyl-CoA dehydrogenase
VIEFELGAFRDRARRWLAAEAPANGWVHDPSLDPEREDPGERLARARACQRALFDAGFAGLTWPVAYGGQGGDNRHQVVFNQEAAAYELPLTPYVIGLGMCGPTLLAVGTEAQKERYLRPMLSGDELWCQLFSEPGAGSDVASLSTRADERSGGGWSLTGQKVWTSGAHHCRYGICLARTDPSAPKHAGLTMFVLDMAAPGVTVRPLRQMTGSARFNEVFLDDVVVGADDVLGVVGGGWQAAIATLMNERVSIGAGSPNSYGHDVPALVSLARDQGRIGHGPTRQELAGCWIDARLHRMLGQRVSEAVLAGRQPGPEGSLAKLAGTRLAKRTAATAVGLAGPGALAWPADASDGQRQSRLASIFLAAPGLSIAGGTDEILRNVVAERVLGLPKEPR